MARHTEQSVDKIEKVMERDYFMSPDEAVSFGLIDRVISKHSDAAADKL